MSSRASGINRGLLLLPTDYSGVPRASGDKPGWWVRVTGLLSSSPRQRG
ncbi:hypothetical protein ACVZD4_17335 [Escherichia coli]